MFKIGQVLEDPFLSPPWTTGRKRLFFSKAAPHQQSANLRMAGSRLDSSPSGHVPLTTTDVLIPPSTIRLPLAYKELRAGGVEHRGARQSSERDLPSRVCPMFRLRAPFCTCLSYSLCFPWNPSIWMLETAHHGLVAISVEHFRNFELAFYQTEVLDNALCARPQAQRCNPIFSNR